MACLVLLSQQVERKQMYSFWLHMLSRSSKSKPLIHSRTCCRVIIGTLFFDSKVPRWETTTSTYSVRHDDANLSNFVLDNRPSRIRLSHDENFLQCDTLDHTSIFMQIRRLIVPRRFAEGKPISPVIAPRFAIVFMPLTHNQRLFITDFIFDLCTNLTLHQLHRKPTFVTLTNLNGLPFFRRNVFGPITNIDKITFKFFATFFTIFSRCVKVAYQYIRRHGQ